MLSFYNIASRTTSVIISPGNRFTYYEIIRVPTYINDVDDKRHRVYEQGNMLLKHV